MTIAMIGFSYVTLLSLIAAYFDLRYMIIPNWISIALIGGFLIFGFAEGYGLEQWLWHVGIAALVFFVGFGLFSLHLMGGGDVKLLAAISLWVASHLILPFVFYVSLVGAGVALARMLYLVFKLKRSGEKLSRASLLKSEIPYGVAIAAGAVLVTFPYS